MTFIFIVLLFLLFVAVGSAVFGRNKEKQKPKQVVPGGPCRDDKKIRNGEGVCKCDVSGGYYPTYVNTEKKELVSHLHCMKCPPKMIENNGVESVCNTKSIHGGKTGLHTQKNYVGGIEIDIESSSSESGGEIELSQYYNLNYWTELKNSCCFVPMEGYPQYEGSSGCSQLLRNFSTSTLPLPDGLSTEQLGITDTIEESSTELLNCMDPLGSKNCEREAVIDLLEILKMSMELIADFPEGDEVNCEQKQLNAILRAYKKCTWSRDVDTCRDIVMDMEGYKKHIVKIDEYMETAKACRAKITDEFLQKEYVGPLEGCQIPQCDHYWIWKRESCVGEFDTWREWINANGIKSGCKLNKHSDWINETSCAKKDGPTEPPTNEEDEPPTNQENAEDVRLKACYKACVGVPACMAKCAMEPSQEFTEAEIKKSQEDLEYCSRKLAVPCSQAVWDRIYNVLGLDEIPLLECDDLEYMCEEVDYDHEDCKDFEKICLGAPSVASVGGGDNPQENVELGDEPEYPADCDCSWLPEAACKRYRQGLPTQGDHIIWDKIEGWDESCWEACCGQIEEPAPNACVAAEGKGYDVVGGNRHIQGQTVEEACEEAKHIDGMLYMKCLEDLCGP